LNTTLEPPSTTGEVIHEMQAKGTMPEINILKMSMGITCRLSMDDGKIKCHWAPPPPYSREVCKQIAREYEPWRNRIIADYAQKTGTRVTVITL